MKAAFYTDGKTTTHSDLFSKSLGIPLSGVPRISFITLYASFSRASSFSWAHSGLTENANNRIQPSLFIVISLCIALVHQMELTCEGESQTVRINDIVPLA